MEYRVLGSLEVLDASGRKLPLGGAMQQSVLASLLLRAGQTVPLDRLIDELWHEPPATAARTVRVYVSRLRRALPAGAIESRAGGYAFALDSDELDLDAFERRAKEGHAALVGAECERAASLLREALALWRGPALAGLTSAALQRQAGRLEELRLSVLEDRIEADLGGARHGELVPELTALVAEHPFRERLRAQLMRALFRSGRPGDALALYRETRRLLVEELGMEPGQELRELEQAILRQDAELEAPKPKRPPPVEPLASKPPVAQGPPRQVRKTVTVLFCDLVGSTALGEATDPEAVRALLARYFERMKTIVERHGGTVEKFIGDAVMAVFGVPHAHEDDALRACRAALDMRDSFPELGIEGRIGITTGEVVTGTEERLATGDPVNVAARLQQTAQPGEVLVGEATLQLVRRTVVVDSLGPLELKGKAQPVDAYRLLALREVARLHEGHFVGRERERAVIHGGWQRARAGKRCELVTVVGEAGVGKSRLVAEALASIDAPVVQGRCLPYGEGITYLPIVEVIRQLDALPSDPAAAASIRSLLGKTHEGTSAEEIAWAFRKLLEEQAPLIAVFDDIQWGEETFLDLIEGVALLASEAPILLLCMARTDLGERRPQWPVALLLEPLEQGDVDSLLPDTIPASRREQIARAAGGNPLFVTEMVAMAAEGEGELAVPPTLQALLAARLDQLEAVERLVLERGAVEGEIFHRGAVQALSQDNLVTPRLVSLVRKGLIHPHTTQIPGEDAFRFRHLLFRDAAYDALPKSTRAELHEAFADWLEEKGRDLVELEELLGFHLERAARYVAELGQPDQALAERAGERLAMAGHRALWRDDERAAAPLLERALELTRPLHLDVHLELDLADSQQRPREQAAIAERAALRAREAGDRAGEALGLVVAAEALNFAGDAAVDELERLARMALPLLRQVGDDGGLARVWNALCFGANARGRFDEAGQAAEHALRHCRLAGQIRFGAFSALAMALIYGPQPADKALHELDSILPTNAPPSLLVNRAQLLAMLGRLDEAWALALPAAERLRELTGAGDCFVAEIATLAGDHATAADLLREVCGTLERQGNRGLLSTYAPVLGRSLCALGRYDEAEPLAQLGRELGDNEDLLTQMLWRQVQARVDAHRGDHAKAERLAREAGEIGEQTDALNAQGDAYCDLAEVLAAAERTEEAAAVLNQALGRYERKRNVAMAGRVRARLAELRRSPAPAERG